MLQKGHWVALDYLECLFFFNSKLIIIEKKRKSIQVIPGLQDKEPSAIPM